MENTTQSTSVLNVVFEFKFNDKVLKMVKPSPKVIREAKMENTKSFTEAIKRGIYTKKKLELVLKSGEINVIEDYIIKRTELLNQYNLAKDQSELTNSPEELETYANLLTIYKQRVIQEDLSMNNVFANTADQIAEEDKINFLTSELIVDEFGNKLWKSTEDFLNDNNFELLELCKYQVICWTYGLSPDATPVDPASEALIIKAQNLRLERDKSTLPIVKEVKKTKKDVTRAKKPKPKKAGSK